MLEPLVVVVSKDEVLRGDISPALGVLQALLKSPEIARRYREKVDIAFHGYDDHPAELFEIPEVRNYVYELDEKFPFWLYFLSKHYLGLQALLFCFLPPYLKEEAKKDIFPQKIDSLLSNRWFPALNHIGQFVGMDERQNIEITERTIQYICSGPLPFHDVTLDQGISK